MSTLNREQIGCLKFEVTNTSDITLTWTHDKYHCMYIVILDNSLLSSFHTPSSSCFYQYITIIINII